ncbi:MAG: error-prone DNA polymerase [Verrucomicrobiota bacterium JB022]|nr:error-prone DNA polymerase [Verrucomicrobiota bacterium JB022]
MSYVELHARSAFSWLRGASQPEALIDAASSAELPAMALLDRNGLYGTARFHAAGQEEGVRPLVGSELVMADGSVLPVLVATQEGYQGLSRLLTRALLRAPKGEAQVTWDELPEFAEGLIALSGDPQEGPLRRAWEREGKAGLEASVARLQAIFPHDRLCIELQRHHLRGESVWNRVLQDVATQTGLTAIATGGVDYAKAEGRRVADIFTCLRHHTHLDAAGTLLSRNSERHVKGEAAMRRLFADCPALVDNTQRVADRLEFTLHDLGYRFPDYPVPAGETMDSFLRKVTWFGASQRYGGISPAVRAQIERELALIAKLGFAGYFLIVWDICNYCREKGILVQGRGSAANSTVCYSLGITAVDPVGGKLLFERFLSEGRKSWPDIDLDLPSGDRRESVIQEVYERYGRLGAAMTANVITYRGRSAVREIGKALNLPEALLGRFSQLFHHGDFQHTMALKDHLAQAGIGAEHPRTPALLDCYRQMYGLPRHLGQHSGGMVICQGRLDSVVPLENASMLGRTVCQWDKDDCEDLGIVKVDLLGLGMMAVMQDAIELTRERGRGIDLAQIPKDDPATYDLLCAADTVGVFQVESRAQMATLPRMQPREFYDLVIEVAIIRPGPIAGRLAHPYLERRAGRERPTFIDERLRPVLDRTLGIPLFQEQVLRMAMIMAEFSGDEAEELRRALSFHRSEERMNRIMTKLRRALREQGYGEDVVEEMVKAISSFALYGFPESHAISFALIAYASAYLKVHRAAEFYTGLLNNQPMGFYSSATLIQDARRRGLRFRAPCVVESQAACTIEDDHTIRLGLDRVRGVNRQAIEAALQARHEAPFRSLDDFKRRTRFARDELRALARVGALNAFCGNRRRALWEVERVHSPGDLFDWAASQASGPDTAPEEIPDLDPLPPMSPQERVEADFSGMGMTVGPHPLKQLRPGLPPHIWTAARLSQGRTGQRVTVAGAVICRQRPGTAKGVVFISLEDETGIANCVVYSKLFERLRLTIVSEPYLQITGELQLQHGTIHVIASTIQRLDTADGPVMVSHDFR